MLQSGVLEGVKGWSVMLQAGVVEGVKGWSVMLHHYDAFLQKLSPFRKF